jgi:hypothetical protein
LLYYYGLFGFCPEVITRESEITNTRKGEKMCFSAGASFAGGALITAAGVATVRKVREPSNMLFASIPLFFGLQQFAEGVVWLTLRSGGNNRLQDVAAYIFLVIALVIWPVMIPLSVRFMESLKKRKKILIIFLLAGALVSAYYAYHLLFYNVAPRIASHHIQYKGNAPRSLRLPAFILYLTATITPLFISSVRKTYIMGILIALSCLASGIFYKEYHTSVWCFFAALISIIIFWIIRDSGKADIFKTEGTRGRKGEGENGA